MFVTTCRFSMLYARVIDLLVKWTELKCIPLQWSSMYVDTHEEVSSNIFENHPASNITSCLEMTEIPPHVHLLSLEMKIILAVEISLCIAGTIGNVLCMVILLHPTQRHFRKTPYLVSLSISDITTLNGFSQMRLVDFTATGLPGPLGWCNINYWVTVSALHMSSTAVVMFTMHRVLCLYYPKANTRLLSKKTSIIGLITCWVMTLAVFAPLLLTYKSSMVCEFVPEWEWFDYDFRPIVQLIWANVLTDIIIFIGNIAIIIRVFRIRRNLRDISVTSPRSQSLPSTQRQDEPYKNVMRTCLGLGVFHVLTTLPSMILIVDWGLRDVERASYFDALPMALLLLATVNYAGNFLVYIVLSKKFRETFKIIFRGLRIGHVSDA